LPQTEAEPSLLESISKLDELVVSWKGVAENQLLANDAAALVNNFLGWLASCCQPILAPPTDEGRPDQQKREVAQFQANLCKRIN
jgi:hypothetical protein